MDNFLNLRADKQDHIINAALNAFGKNGYKKASLAEIAQEAGIAKGMINYYFGSKKNLYLHLLQMSTKVVGEAMAEKKEQSKDIDFFDNVKAMIKVKSNMIKAHPAIYLFLTSVHYETNEEVYTEIKEFFTALYDTREKILFEKIDISRFKEDIDPELVDKFMIWGSEGFLSTIQKDLNAEKIDEFIDDINNFVDIMKKYFYKEEER
jgi:AcrR family transcriptional regulator